jgi:hypothetical protein
MLRTVGLYLHPAAGLTTVALAAYTASLGLRSRRPGARALAARRRHRAIGPVLYVLVLLDWVGGLVATWRFRPEMGVAESGHFASGSALVALFTAALLLSRRIPFDPRARTLHPLVGATALVVAGVQVFLGLQLLP